MLSIALVADRWYSASLCCNSKSGWWCGRDDLQPHEMLTWIWCPLGLSSWPSKAMLVELLKTARERSTELPPLVNEGQNSGNISGSRLVLRSQEGNHVREPFNYIGQGEKTLIFSIQPLQLFIQPLVFYKMKGRLFLVFAEFARGELQLSVYHWVTSLTSTWPTHVKLQPVTSTSAAAVPSHCQLTPGTELCKCSCHIADRKFLLV